ncbi:hypothetical protein [Photobacterium carnosum]|nr:hypothetical protein [Photobacterium carnosum]
MNNIFYWLLFTAKNKLKAQQPVLKQLALTVVYVFFCHHNHNYNIP